MNIAPPITAQAVRENPLWEEWLDDAAEGRFGFEEAHGGNPAALRILEHSARVAWRSVPRKVEPRKEYRLEGEIRGAGRLVLRWVRVEKKWLSEREGLFEIQETPLDEIRGQPVSDAAWQAACVGGVAPRQATHCRIILEAHEPAPLTEFRGLFLDGLGVELLDLQYSQAGYHPDAFKTAVIQFAGEAKDGRFHLLDDAGKEVLAEDLELIERKNWGRSYWLADFSLFRKEGNYALAIEIGGRHRRTRYFPIRRDCYTRLSELTLQWFHTQRCGIEIPGWHKICHADDGMTAQAEPGVAAVGGWHDGGSYDKITRHHWMSIHALTHLYEKGGGQGHDFGGHLPDSLEEARWGADYLLQIATGDGRFALAVSSPPGTNYFGPPESETDNQPATGDERSIGPPCDWTTAALCSYSLANFARVVEKMQPDLAARCFNVAEKTFAVLEETKKPEDPIGQHSAAALLCIGLWRARGLEKYREECSWRILSILQYQKEEGIFTQSAEYLRRMFFPLADRIQAPDMADPDMGVEYAPVPFLYLQALICYLERSIDDALALEIRGALDKFLVQIKESAEVSPFGQIGELTLADRPVSFPVMPRGHNAFYLACTYMLAKASLLLERDDLAGIAQRQFEWVLGRNVRGTSMVCGAGHKDLGVYYTRYATNPRHHSGHQAGGVVNGIAGGDGRDYPIDFPSLDVAAVGPEGGTFGLNADPRTNEYWMPNCAWFVLACGELTKMLTAGNVERRQG